MTKTELLSKITQSRQELLHLLASIPREDWTLPGACGDEWSVKDVLVHLNFWQGQLVTFLYQLRQGIEPTTVQVTSPNVDEQNARWYQAGKDRDLDLVWTDFTGLHQQLIRRISAFSEAELNNPKFNPKLHGEPILKWIIMDTYGHEEEHMEVLRRWQADLK